MLISHSTHIGLHIPQCFDLYYLYRKKKCERNWNKVEMSTLQGLNPISGDIDNIETGSTEPCSLQKLARASIRRAITIDNFRKVRGSQMVLN